MAYKMPTADAQHKFLSYTEFQAAGKAGLSISESGSLPFFRVLPWH